MNKTLTVASAILLIAGCNTVANQLNGDKTLLVSTKVLDSNYGTQTYVHLNTINDVNHITVGLYLLPGDTLLASKSIATASIATAIRFHGLKAYTNYRVRATAYPGTSESGAISDPNTKDFSVTNDDAVTMTALNVKLTDTPFNGLATASGIVVASGSYSYSASESIGTGG
jgi:hypothetical protein